MTNKYYKYNFTEITEEEYLEADGFGSVIRIPESSLGKWLRFSTWISLSSDVVKITNAKLVIDNYPDGANNLTEQSMMTCIECNKKFNLYVCRPGVPMKNYSSDKCNKCNMLNGHEI